MAAQPRVRNSSRFSLPKSPGRFFPDLIVELNNDRNVLVEYKWGKLAHDPEELHKRDIGELWAQRSETAHRFGWVVDQDWQALNHVLDIECSPYPDGLSTGVHIRQSRPATLKFGSKYSSGIMRPREAIPTWMKHALTSAAATPPEIPNGTPTRRKGWLKGLEPSTPGITIERASDSKTHVLPPENKSAKTGASVNITTSYNSG